MKKTLFLITFLLLIGYVFAAENLSQQAGKYPADKVYLTAKTKQIPLMLIFYADWCAESKEYMPLIDNLENRYGDKIIFLKVNVEGNQNNGFVKKYKSNKYLPQTVIYNKGFEKIADFTGKKNKQELESIIMCLASQKS